MNRAKLTRIVCVSALATVSLIAVMFLTWNGWKQWQGRREYEQVRLFAANLANDEFANRFGQRPFRPDMYEPELHAGRWYWGSFEPAEFFSAEVSFRRDTTDPKLRIFWATDGHEPVEHGLNRVPND